MALPLQNGTTFAVSSHSGTVVSRIGGGTQGEVYRVSFNGQDAALKWYHPQHATPDQWNAIEELVTVGSPSPSFLWPEGIATSSQEKGFGYLMPLRPSGFASIPDLLDYRVQPTFKALVKGCFHLAAAFGALHRKGLCYLDISHGNAFIHPKTGEVLICDNDNAGVAGQGKPSVRGTPRFMAPEVVLGAPPSVESDLFSLGVLMFYILFLNHPLDGAKEANIRAFNIAAMRRLYGEEPVFLFDPNDPSNRPIPGFHDNALIYWELYPGFLKERFVDLFTTGLKAPHERPRSLRWEQLFTRMLDSIVMCPCGAENFYDRDRLDLSSRTAGSCWRCKKAVPLPPRLQVDGQRIVVLNPDTQLFPHHLNFNHSLSFEAPIGEVTRHPTTGAWGIRNVSSARWTYVRSDGARQDLEPGRAIALSADLKIDCGGGDFEVRV